jgi:hypothetical protein
MHMGYDWWVKLMYVYGVINALLVPKDRANRTTLKIGRVISCCTTSDIRRIALATNRMISHEWVRTKLWLLYFNCKMNHCNEIIYIAFFSSSNMSINIWIKHLQFYESNRFMNNIHL